MPSISYEASKKFMTDWLEKKANQNSERSRNTYGKEYALFCTDHSVQSEWDTSCAMYLRWGLEVKGRKRSTICNSMSGAVFNMFRYTDFAPTRSNLVVATRAAITRHTEPSKGKKFLPIPMLVRMVDAMDTEHFAQLRDGVILTLMTLGCLRQGNTTDLLRGDVWIDKTEECDEAIFIFLDKSKNDPERVGHTVVIAPGKGTKLEPLEQVKMYLRRMEAHPEATHFFHSSRTPYPRLSKKTPNHLIKKWLTKIGVDPKPYGSHSCRKGGARRRQRRRRSASGSLSAMAIGAATPLTSISMTTWTRC